jgi:hypothetical protein
MSAILLYNDALLPLQVMEHLRKKDKIMVVQNAPATRITVAEEFFGEPGYIKPLQVRTRCRTSKAVKLEIAGSHAVLLPVSATQ